VGDEGLQPAKQRLGGCWIVQQGFAPVAQLGDLLGIGGDDQLAAGREVPVHGGVADPGPVGDVVHGGVDAVLVEDLLGRGQ
jgi:hypothetical protein